MYVKTCLDRLYYDQFGISQFTAHIFFGFFPYYKGLHALAPKTSKDALSACINIPVTLYSFMASC